ncbi:MAG TPA: ABC transporter permease [Acidimicrobiales bacterium]|nr:ABC transporter permease [Acidimicrobiales bacterium]
MHSQIFTFGIEGLVYGCLYSLAASGLVVTYVTSGVFNFAQGAMGMFMTFTYWQFAVAWHVPMVLSLLLVLLVIAPLGGALVERIAIRPLYGASLGLSLMVTLGLLLGILGAADALWSPQVTRHLPDLLGTGAVRVFGLAVTYFQLFVFGASVFVAVAWFVFNRTRVGLTMRAVVDDKDLTARAGANPIRSAQLSWALGASLAALAGILIAPLQYLDQFNLTFLVVTGYAAAVVGRMKSLPLTVAGAMFLGLIQSYAVGYLPVSLLSNLNPVIPFVVLFLALLVLRQDRLQTARPAATRIRRDMGLWPSVAMGVAFVGVTVLLSNVLSAGNVLNYGEGVVLGVVMLSLVLLTGYGGQVSLCQMTLAGFGAFAMGNVFGGDSVFGLLAAAALPAAVGALLALVALRLRGLYLALATLSFAYAMDSLFFNKVLGYGGILDVGRVWTKSQKGFLIEASVIFAALAIGVLALKRGSFGRRLAALNDSEAASAAIGMNLRATKLMVFTIAAAIAGIGGALYGGWQKEVGPSDFASLFSLLVLLLITLAGINTVGGAFAAAMFYAFTPVINNHVHIPQFQFLLVGLGAVFLGLNPGGFAGQLGAAWDRIRLLGSGGRAGASAEIPEAGEGQLVFD